MLLTVRTPDPAYDDVRGLRLADLARLPLAVSVTLRRLDDVEAADQGAYPRRRRPLDDPGCCWIVELLEGVPLLVEGAGERLMLQADA